MDQWTPTEIDAHVQYMHDFADKLRQSGEFVDAQGAVPPEGTFVRYDGPGAPTRHRRPVPPPRPRT